MSVAEFLNSPHETAFSFEVLPPVKGHSIEQIYKTIDRLRQFNPAYINITTHRSDYIYREKEPGIYIRQEERHRYNYSCCKCPCCRCNRKTDY